MDEEVGVLGADVGAAYGKAFEAQFVQEFACGEVGQVFEEASGVGHMDGLCGFALLEELVSFLSGLLWVGAVELEACFNDDLCGESCESVAVRDCVGFESDGFSFVPVVDEDVHQEVKNFFSVGAGVHDECAAYASGYSGEFFQACVALSDGFHDELWPAGACAGLDE